MKLGRLGVAMVHSGASWGHAPSPTSRKGIQESARKLNPETLVANTFGQNLSFSY